MKCDIGVWKNNRQMIFKQFSQGTCVDVPHACLWTTENEKSSIQLKAYRNWKGAKIEQLVVGKLRYDCELCWDAKNTGSLLVWSFTHLIYAVLPYVSYYWDIHTSDTCFALFKFQRAFITFNPKSLSSVWRVQILCCYLISYV